MQTRGSTNKSPIKLSVQWQAVISKGILVPYTNLQLNLYSNTQLDLFCSDNFSFWCMAPSTWLTNCVDPVRDFNHQLEEVVGCKILQFIPTMKIKKMLDANLQLNSYPNTQLDLFYSDNFSFWCTAPSTWLTNCVDSSTRLQSPTREGCWLQSSSVHPWWRSRRCLVTKPYGAQTQQLLHNNDELGQNLSPVTICLNKLCSTLVLLVSTLTTLKIILLYV